MRDVERLLVLTLELESAVDRRRYGELHGLLQERAAIIERLSDAHKNDPLFAKVRNIESRTLSRLSSATDAVRRSLVGSAQNRRRMDGYAKTSRPAHRFEQSG